MKVKVKLYSKNINDVCDEAKLSLIETADAVKSDLVQSQTMPFDTGALQNRSTFVDKSDSSKGIVSIVSDTPYARKLYYHPEYNFQRGKNANAGGMWFEPYINGSKNKFCQNTFSRLLRSKFK